MASVSRSNKRRLDVASSVSDADVQDFVAEIQNKLKSKKKADAECALLFGCTIFPNNLDLKKSAYIYAKSKNNAYEASSYFYSLYPQSPKWEEVDEVIRDVQDQKKSILSDMFYNLPFSMQYELVNTYAKNLSMKASVKLSLTVLQEQHSRQEGKYFTPLQQGQVMHQVDRIARDLLAAELQERENSNESSDSPLNWCRWAAVRQLFPLVYECARQGCHLVDKALIHRLFTQALQFLLCYAAHIPRISPSTDRIVTLVPNIVGVDAIEAEAVVKSGLTQQPWQVIRKLLHQVAVIFNWALKEVDIREMSLDAAHDLLKQWSHQLQSSSSRHQSSSSGGTGASSTKLARLEVGAVYWSMLSEAIMRYLKASRPSLWQLDTPGNVPRDQQDDEDANKDVFFLKRNSTARKESPDGGQSHLQQCSNLFHTAIQLYEALSGSTAAKYTGKVEANLRVPTHWLFDRLFFVDYYLSLGTLQGAASALLVLDTLGTLHETHQLFLRSVLHLQLGKVREAWSLLWSCYQHFLQRTNRRVEARQDFERRLQQFGETVCTPPSTGTSPQKNVWHVDTVLSPFSEMQLDTVSLFHVVTRFLLWQVVAPLITTAGGSGLSASLCMSAIILSQVVEPSSENQEKSVLTSRTVAQLALDGLQDLLSLAGKKSTVTSATVRVNIMDMMPFVHESEFRSHLTLLIQAQFSEKGQLLLTALPDNGKSIQPDNASVWFSVVRFMDSHQDAFKDYIARIVDNVSAK